MSFSKPIFLKSADCPKTSTFDICLAAENVAGEKTMRGAQYMGNKWRIYPSDDACRAKLLASGLFLDAKHVQLYSSNPFAPVDDDGNEIETIKLTIDGVPISFSDESIRKRLEETGVILRSRILLEYARNPLTKKMTNWLTGRRFIYIEVPKKDLPKYVSMGPFKARLLYRDPSKENTVKCRKCLGSGHWASTCNNLVKCLDCGQEGHKRGDENCMTITSIFGDNLNDQGDNQEEEVKTIENEITNEDNETKETAAPVVSSESTEEPQSDASETAHVKVSTQKKKKKNKNKNKKYQVSKDSIGIDKNFKKLNNVAGTSEHLRTGKSTSNSADNQESAGRGRQPVKNNLGGRSTLDRFLSRSRSGSVPKRDRSKSPGDCAHPKEKAHKTS